MKHFSFHSQPLPPFTSSLEQENDIPVIRDLETLTNRQIFHPRTRDQGQAIQTFFQTIPDTELLSAFTAAVQRGYADVVRFLFWNGMETRFPNLLAHAFSTAAEYGQVDMMAEWLERVDAMSFLSKDDFEILTVAATSCHPQAIDLLVSVIKEQASVRRYQSMLQAACKHGCVHAAELAVQAGANLGARSRITGETPLVAAVTSTSEDRNAMIEWLLDQRPNLIKTATADDILHIACQQKKATPLLELLVRRGAKIPPHFLLEESIKKNKYVRTRRLLDTLRLHVDADSLTHIFHEPNLSEDLLLLCLDSFVQRSQQNRRMVFHLPIGNLFCAMGRVSVVRFLLDTVLDPDQVVPFAQSNRLLEGLVVDDNEDDEQVKNKKQILRLLLEKGVFVELPLLETILSKMNGNNADSFRILLRVYAAATSDKKELLHNLVDLANTAIQKDDSLALQILLEQPNMSPFFEKDMFLLTAARLGSRSCVVFLIDKYYTADAIRPLFLQHPRLLESYASFWPEYQLPNQGEWTQTEISFRPPASFFCTTKIKFLFVGSVFCVFESSNSLLYASRFERDEVTNTLNMHLVPIPYRLGPENDALDVNPETIEDVVGVGSNHIALLTRKKSLVDLCKFLRRVLLVPFRYNLAKATNDDDSIPLVSVERGNLDMDHTIVLADWHHLLEEYKTAENAALVCLGDRLVVIAETTHTANPESPVSVMQHIRVRELHPFFAIFSSFNIVIPLPEGLVLPHECFAWNAFSSHLIRRLSEPPNATAFITSLRIRADAQLLDNTSAPYMQADVEQESFSSAAFAGIALPNTPRLLGKLYICPTHADLKAFVLYSRKDPLEKLFDTVNQTRRAAMERQPAIVQSALSVALQDAMVDSKGSRFLRQVFSQQNPRWSIGLKRLYGGKAQAARARFMPLSVADVEIIEHERNVGQVMFV